MNYSTRYYQEIGNLVVNVIGKNHSKVLLYAEIEDLVISADIFFTVSESVVRLRFAPDDLSDLIYNFWDDWRKLDTNHEWRAMSYVIQDDKITVDLIYPDKIDFETPYHKRRQGIIEKHFGRTEVDQTQPRG